MKPVLILEHQIPENIAYLGTWLKNHNIDYVVFNAERDKEFPTSIEPYSALAVMGGSMSANDPLLTNKQAEILILQAMYRDVPVIGHCLGGQLMAKALGAKIKPSFQTEIGWQHVKYINTDLGNEWFSNNPYDTVIHWHHESFEVPTGATLLVTNDSCPNQAFSIGKHLAMQFHIEVDRDKIDFWVSKYAKSDEHLNLNSVQTKEEMLYGIDKHLQNHQNLANQIYKNWLKTTELNINLM